MDFAKFRSSGDLSDIIVAVDGTEFKLHKFPLFAKSDYFCSLARNSLKESSRVTLTEFPGGADIFNIIADFCYGMKTDITKNNVVQLRCASEFLQMSGPGNLIEAADKFLHDTITSAKMSKSTNLISCLLLYCVSVGGLADKAGIVPLCSEALVECWLKPPTKFSTPTASKKQGTDKSDDKCIKAMMNLPLEWFVKILITARDKGVKLTHLAEMATRYVSTVLEKLEADDSKGQSQEAMKTASKKEAKNNNAQPIDLLKDAKPAEKSKKSAEVGKLLDAILLELPEEAFLQDVVTTEWVTKVLRIATAKGCICRRLLIKVAGEMLNKLSAEDLCIVSPSILHDIVKESVSGDGSQTDKACNIVDTYMAEMVRKSILTTETFKLLATAVPAEARHHHDQLYDVLEYVLSAEKDKLSAEQRQEIVDTVDFTRMNEDTLQRALKVQVVPATNVAKGALALCSRLKAEVNNVRSVAEELQKQQRGRNSATPTITSPPRKEVDLSRNDPPVRESSKHRESSPARPGGQDAVSAARTKLNNTAHYNSFRPLNTDQDIGYEEELDYSYDRSPFRSLDPRVRNPAGGSYRSPYGYPHRM